MPVEPRRAALLFVPKAWRETYRTWSFALWFGGDLENGAGVKLGPLTLHRYRWFDMRWRYAVCWRNRTERILWGGPLDGDTYRIRFSMDCRLRSIWRWWLWFRPRPPWLRVHLTLHRDGDDGRRNGCWIAWLGPFTLTRTFER